MTSLLSSLVSRPAAYGLRKIRRASDKSSLQLWKEMPDSEAVSNDQYASVESLAKETGYSTEHLYDMLNSDEIEGIKVGDMWLATLTAVKAHQAEDG